MLDTLIMATVGLSYTNLARIAHDTSIGRVELAALARTAAAPRGVVRLVGVPAAWVKHLLVQQS